MNDMQLKSKDEISNDIIKLEIWKSIKNFETLYEVSSLGRIRRVAGSTWGKFKLNSSRLLRNHPSKNGYRTVSLYNYDKKKKTYSVHQLVATAFLGDNTCCSMCGNILEINHKDRNKQNNQSDNLEYVTRRENMKYYHGDKESPNEATSLTKSS